MKQKLIDKIEQISDEVASSSCNNGESKLITGMLDELTGLINKNDLLSDVSHRALIPVKSTKEIAQLIANYVGMPYCWEDLQNRIEKGLTLPFKISDS